jgi:molybdopterin-biosynthesis enzyme MoeA-like protein
MSGHNPSKDDIATLIMAAMVKMPPEHHKDATKPLTKRAEAQRRRRENERRRQAQSPIVSS